MFPFGIQIQRWGRQRLDLNAGQRPPRLSGSIRGEADFPPISEFECYEKRRRKSFFQGLRRHFLLLGDFPVFSKGACQGLILLLAVRCQKSSKISASASGASVLTSWPAPGTQVSAALGSDR